MVTESRSGWCTLRQASEFLGITIQGVHRSYLPELADGDVDRSIKPMRVRSAAVLDLAASRRADARTGDPLLVDGDSAGLERYRLAKAAHAELDLAERKNELIDKEFCRALMGRWSHVLRRAGDRLNKRCGTEGASILREAIDECESIVRDIGSRPGRSD